MKRVHIVGGKNHGKTTLMVDLVRELHAMGLRVGTIKHTHHRHELDTPGKDSHQHREAGASVVGIYSPGMNGLFWTPGSVPHRSDADSGSDLKYTEFAPMFAHCDLVLVEGDSHATAPKLEVWREVVGTAPLADEGLSITALVSDDDLGPDRGVPIWPRSDVPALAKKVLALIGVGRTG